MRNFDLRKYLAENRLLKEEKTYDIYGDGDVVIDISRATPEQESLIRWESDPQNGISEFEDSEAAQKFADEIMNLNSAKEVKNYYDNVRGWATVDYLDTYKAVNAFVGNKPIPENKLLKEDAKSELKRKVKDMSKEKFIELAKKVGDLSKFKEALKGKKDDGTSIDPFSNIDDRLEVIDQNFDEKDAEKYLTESKLLKEEITWNIDAYDDAADVYEAADDFLPEVKRLIQLEIGDEMGDDELESYIEISNDYYHDIARENAKGSDPENISITAKAFADNVIEAWKEDNE